MWGYYEHLNRVMDEWAEKEGVDAIDVDKASDYAIANNLIPRLPLTLKQQTMRDMRRALQAKTYIDPQGNKVRARHALRHYQMELPNMPTVQYIDPRTAKPDPMEKVLDQIFEGIKNDVKRHAIEKQSYDLNNVYDATLHEYNYDFRAIADDARMTGKYDDELPEDFGDDLD